MSRAKPIFITGTDTGVGKTLVACAVIHAFIARGLRVAAMKPVASGSELMAEGLRNSDALALQHAANVRNDYATVNPYCFAPPVAPHLAARQVGEVIELTRLQQVLQRAEQGADLVVVEGAGGWRVPLATGPSGNTYLSEFAEALRMEVILVVGLRLGCLNHALLTAQAIQSGPCRLLGWVGNGIDPHFALAQDNLASLQQCLPAPCLGVLPYQAAPDAQASSALLTLPA